MERRITLNEAKQIWKERQVPNPVREAAMKGIRPFDTVAEFIVGIAELAAKLGIHRDIDIQPELWARYRLSSEEPCKAIECNPSGQITITFKENNGNT